MRFKYKSLFQIIWATHIKKKSNKTTKSLCSLLSEDTTIILKLNYQKGYIKIKNTYKA